MDGTTRSSGGACRRAWSGAARGVLLFFGAFALLNGIGDAFSPGFDANIWWLDARASPRVGRAVLLLIGAAMVAGAVRPRGLARWLAAGACALALGVAGFNAIGYYRLTGAGVIRGGPVPLSLLIAATLAMLLATLLMRRRREDGRAGWAFAALAFVATAVLFPLGQMACFGRTDYRRPADAAVVFGALAHADGRPSDALADRVRTAAELYRAGLVKKLVMTGGPGAGAVHETEAMRDFAASLGVPREDILLDKAGLNTDASVESTVPLLRRMGARRVLAVSHFYHLPRVKMIYARAGQEVYTVPARESYPLRKMPYFVAREVAAVWVYYVRG